MPAEDTKNAVFEFILGVSEENSPYGSVVWSEAYSRAARSIQAVHIGLMPKEAKVMLMLGTEEAMSNERGESMATALTSKPLPRYRRARQGVPGLLLQERDLALLEDVWRFRWLTTSQLEQLRSSDPDPARRFTSRLPLTRRLKLLFHHGYLSRLARPRAQGSLEPVYLLDRAGARALRSRFEEAVARPPSQHPKAAALEHLLLINQVRVSLTAACHLSQNVVESGGEIRVESAVEFVVWEPSSRVKFAVTMGRVGERERRVTLIPDGFCTLKINGQRLFFFVEADRDTEPKKTLIDKCRTYYRYWQSGGFAHDFGVPPQIGFRVLFVVSTPKRAQTLLSGLEQLSAGRGLFWVTTADQVMPDRILQPVWWGHGSARRWSVSGRQEAE